MVMAWRRIVTPLQATARPTPMPVAPTAQAETSTAADTAASVSRCAIAARRLRSWPLPVRNRRAENRFTAIPSAAAHTTGPLVTGTGSTSRRIPSTVTTAAAIRINTALAREASWVLRPKP